MNIRNEKGITILSLIITIIVMSILASIAISASVGDNSVIKKTKEATIKASIREVQEALDTHILLKEKENINKGTNIDLSDILSVYSGDIYTVNILNLDIKGDYGKGTNKDVFRAKKNSITDYEVFYVDDKGVEHYAMAGATN